MKTIFGSYKFKVHPEEGKEIEVDFTPPFRRMRMLPELEKEMGVSLGWYYSFTTNTISGVVSVYNVF